MTVEPLNEDDAFIRIVCEPPMNEKQINISANLHCDPEYYNTEKIYYPGDIAKNFELALHDEMMRVK